MSLDEFLVWERAQPLLYEFDGIQPIAMTGGSTMHARLITRLVISVGTRLRPPCEVFVSELKIVTQCQVRYPDVTVVCVPQKEDGDEVVPTVVFEVLSPSTSLTDRRVKPREYREISSILAYVILSQDAPEVTVMRRSAGWVPEELAGAGAVLQMPEVGIETGLAELYR